MAISIVAVNQVIEPALAALGLDLLGTEFIAQGRNSILRIYIDNLMGSTSMIAKPRLVKSVTSWMWKIPLRVIIT